MLQLNIKLTLEILGEDQQKKHFFIEDTFRYYASEGKTYTYSMDHGSFELPKVGYKDYKLDESKLSKNIEIMKDGKMLGKD